MSEILNMMSNNCVVKPSNLAYRNIFFLSSTSQLHLTVKRYSSSLPIPLVRWWHCSYLGLLHNDFLLFAFLTHCLPLILVSYCSSALTWDLEEMQSPSRVQFFPMIESPSVSPPHHLPHVSFVPPLVCLLPCLKILWAEVSCASLANSRFGMQRVTPSMSGMADCSTRRKQPPTQGTWQLAAGQTLLVMPNKFHTLLQQTLSECLPITKSTLNISIALACEH